MTETGTISTRQFAVAGKVVVALDLDDRSQWPGMKVTSWDKKGRGWSCDCEAPDIVWRAVQLEIENRISGKADTNDLRAALRKVSMAVSLKLGKPNA